MPSKVLADYPDLRKRESSIKQAKSVGWLRDKFLKKIASKYLWNGKYLVDVATQAEASIDSLKSDDLIIDGVVLDKHSVINYISIGVDIELLGKNKRDERIFKIVEIEEPKGVSVEDMEKKSSIKSAKSVGWLRDKFLNKIDKIADVAAEVNDEFKKEREDGEGRGISLIDYYITGRYHEIEKPLSADAITKSQAEKLMEDLVYQFKTELFAIYNISSGAADNIVDEPKGVSMKDIEELEEATDKESAIEKEIEFYPMDSISTGYPSTQYLKDIVEPLKQPEGKYLSY